MKKNQLFHNIEPARAKDASLESRGNTNLFAGNGKNKSVWQSFVDAPGFAKRHPEFFIEKKSK
tara:strand:+ start:335 stop:523 length:189 start_codon:yes stop_codon:yes gene_type:complete